MVLNIVLGIAWLVLALYAGHRALADPAGLWLYAMMASFVTSFVAFVGLDIWIQIAIWPVSAIVLIVILEGRA